MQPMSPKVLVADDSLAVHQVFRNALSAGDFAKIVHAFDGVQCLEALDQGMDIAFIDIHMPKMSGMDALWAARTAGNKTFVTLISGRSNQRCVELARKLDAYELLIKPFGNDGLKSESAYHYSLGFEQELARPLELSLEGFYKDLRGIVQFDQPGIYVTFEESPAAIRRNAASLGFAITEWEREEKWAFVDASSDSGEAATVGT